MALAQAQAQAQALPLSLSLSLELALLLALALTLPLSLPPALLPLAQLPRPRQRGIRRRVLPAGSLRRADRCKKVSKPAQ